MKPEKFVDNSSALIDELEVKLNRLRMLYEQYFMGIEKRPPYYLQKDVVRIMYELEKRKPSKTSEKYRLRQLVQKFNSYRTYWSRTCRQIEEGTYIKHKNKVKKKESEYERMKRLRKETQEQEEGEQRPQVYDLSMESEEAGSLADLYNNMSLSPESAPKANKAKLEELKAKLGLAAGSNTTTQARPAATARPSSPQAPTGSGGGAQGGINVNRLYKDLVEAKRRCNEETNKISPASLQRSIEKQLPALRKKYGSENIGFKVVIKDGKTYLKPVKNNS